MIQLIDIFVYCRGIMWLAISDYIKRLILFSLIQLSAGNAYVLLTSSKYEYDQLKRVLLTCFNNVFSHAFKISFTRKSDLISEY